MDPVGLIVSDVYFFSSKANALNNKHKPPKIPKNVKTVRYAHKGANPCFFNKSTNKVAAYINELDPIKNAVLNP